MHTEMPSGVGRFLVGDIESIGLTRAVNNPSDIHIITLQDYFTNEVFVFYDENKDRVNAVDLGELEGDQDGLIIDGIKMLAEAEAICFQNAVGFDAIVIEKVFPEIKFNWLKTREGKKATNLFPFYLMDTMILSQLLNPDRKLDPKA